MSRAADRRVLFERLYGEGHEAVAADVEALIAKQPGPPGTTGTPWDERDLWLITYADQFRSPGETPLRTMERFLDARVRWVNGVHILPFAPWSSDDGFSVTDYYGVDERYGTWEDIGLIATSKRLMVDAVINHMSAESEWFRGFLAGDSAYDGLFRTADPAADLSATVRPRTTPLLTPFEGPTDPVLVRGGSGDLRTPSHHLTGCGDFGSEACLSTACVQLAVAGIASGSGRRPPELLDSLARSSRGPQSWGHLRLAGTRSLDWAMAGFQPRSSLG